MSIFMQVNGVFQEGSPCDILFHTFKILPLFTLSWLFLPKFGDIFFDFFAKQNLLQRLKSAIFKWQLFVFENFIEIGAKFRVLKLVERIFFRARSSKKVPIFLRLLICLTTRCNLEISQICSIFFLP